MTAQPNIVLVHGAWADGSSWSAVIEHLQADGYQVTAGEVEAKAAAIDHEGQRREQHQEHHGRREDRRRQHAAAVHLDENQPGLTGRHRARGG